ncbi:WASH complex subunit 3-like [Octopus vulgaris]|uniref:WASH complex subunit 3 n=1 Tax=Octopus vulgaris TaxID=6645 RepID=A0AA36BGV2_OCTVU|nr:WASH complex subunit 3-like [Octopus vulgaris]
MDSDGLPLVGTGIDYTKCEAIYQKRTLAFLNHFITHTVRFLNKFSGVCEEKLETMSYRIQRLEIMMNILEAKLSSIPGLENVVAPTPESTSSPSAVANTPSQPTEPVQQTTKEATPSAADPTTPATPAAAPPATPEEPKKTVSQDPRYMKYFKMLSGVPEPAVKIKMQQEGLNPSLLDDPKAPAPPGGSGDDDDSSKDNDSSDSDDFSD